MATSDYQQWVQWLLRLFAFLQTIFPGEWPKPYDIRYDDSFDYIVVGAGSAGAIVATRLSENPHNQVLLLEAGGDPTLANIVPSLFTMIQHSDFNWDYVGYFDKGVGEAHSNGTTPLSRGKGLGGSSSVNYMAYIRGFPEDYDEWNQAAPGWTWNSTLPYFKKLEGLLDPQVMKNPTYAKLHSSTGPVLITRPKLNWYFEGKNNFVFDSFEEIGVKRILDINGNEVQGVTQPHSNFAYGRRYSTAEAYLKPAKLRPNLHVATHTRASKILINDEREAYGVEAILKSGETIKLFAKKEVIVSAGVFESPKLLMLSGIGPQEELNKFEIEVVADLPVGMNYKDHIVFHNILKAQPGNDCEEFNSYALQEFNGYPFPMGVGYFSVNDKSPKRPEFQFFTMYSCANAPNVAQLCKSGANFDDSLCQSVQEANVNRELVAVFLILLHPESTGQVKLKTNNPLDKPVVELGMFRDKKDLDMLTEGVKFVNKLENTTVFKQVGGELVKLQVSGCKGLIFGSDEHWRCEVNNRASPFQHAVGTCVTL